jgi:DNA-binding transcriptional ArsR family regulator
MGAVDFERTLRIFHASLEDLALEAVLELLARSKATGVLAVEGEVAEGELLWEGGRLYDAQVVYPRKASGRRALDYFLGLRRGEVYLEPVRVSRPPTLAGDLLDLAFAAERARVWARASGLPSDWGLTVWPRGKLGALTPLLERAQGKPLAEVLLLYGAPPSAVASVLSSLAKAGLVEFRPKGTRKLFPLWPWGIRQGA